eukprot:g1394.t1
MGPLERGEGGAAPWSLRLEPARAASEGGVRLLATPPGARANDRLQLLLTTDALARHNLPDPPFSAPTAGDAEWMVYLERLAGRLRLRPAAGNAAASLGGDQTQRLELCVGPEPVDAETGLPDGFKLEAASDELEQFSLDDAPAGDGSEESAALARSKSLRSRRRASIVPTGATLGTRTIIPSRQRITEFFRY